jgi:hypothetical protein
MVRPTSRATSHRGLPRNRAVLVMARSPHVSMADPDLHQFFVYHRPNPNAGQSKLVARSLSGTCPVGPESTEHHLRQCDDQPGVPKPAAGTGARGFHQWPEWTDPGLTNEWPPARHHHGPGVGDSLRRHCTAGPRFRPSELAGRHGGAGADTRARPTPPTSGGGWAGNLGEHIPTAPAGRHPSSDPNDIDSKHFSPFPRSVRNPASVPRALLDDRRRGRGSAGW